MENKNITVWSSLWSYITPPLSSEALPPGLLSKLDQINKNCDLPFWLKANKKINDWKISRPQPPSWKEVKVAGPDLSLFLSSNFSTGSAFGLFLKLV